MSDLKRFVQFLILYFVGAVLTATSFMFGAAPLTATYWKLGRGLFWLSWLGLCCLLFGAGLKAFAALLLCLTLLVGLFNEFRKLNLNLFTSGIVAVLLMGSLTCVASFQALKKNFGPEWFSKTAEATETYLNENLPAALTQESSFKAQDLLVQAPSAVFIMMVLALFIAVLAEKNFMSVDVLNGPLVKEKIEAFRLPDGLIWLFIGSLLAAFVKTTSPYLNHVGMNFLNGLLVLYFLQGIAIVAAYFNVTKASVWWRAISYFLLTTQLFLLTSCLGVLDYWFDFRSKIYKKSAEVNSTWKNQV